jgi:tetratricopeptide (TPR) repeat protein
MGRPAEALPNYEAAMQMYQRLYKGDHPATAQSRRNLADCLGALGRPAEAEQGYQDATLMFQRLLTVQGENRLTKYNLARTQQKLGDLLAKLGRAEEARDNYGRALKLAESMVAGDATDGQANQLLLGLRVKLGLEKAAVVVVGLAPGRQGEQIGLYVGDVITLYAGEPITSADQFRLLTGQIKALPHLLEIRRDGQHLELSTTGADLGAQCEDRSASEAK